MVPDYLRVQQQQQLLEELEQEINVSDPFGFGVAKDDLDCSHVAVPSSTAAPGAATVDDSTVQVFSLSGFGNDFSSNKIRLEYTNPDVIEELNRVRVGRRAE